MAANDELRRFARDLRQDVIAQASLEGAEATLPGALTQRFVEDLTEVAELDDANVAFSKGRGYEASGYAVADDGGRVDLLITIMPAVPGTTVTRQEVETAFGRLLAFYRRARSGVLHLSLEESTPEWDMAVTIGQLEAIRRLRLYVLTDGVTTVDEKSSDVIVGVDVSFHVWDVRRLHRAMTSGQQQEPIDIDFVSRYGEPLPCLVAPTRSDDYTAHLAIIPGRILSDIYDEYGARLLERNVRAFLQARGKVNRGIQETIAKEPDRFLAYNNGISATASEVKIVDVPGGGTAIAEARDFQIVNGGQTTASLHHAEHRTKAELSDVYVQAKLTVVDPEELATIVPLISRYANSQNKVNEADFQANDPFHVQIEKLSRSVWAPAPEGTQRNTKWFYERARGQYQDELAREPTPARKRQFRTTHPPHQRFTKTDLAKFENTWDQLPHVVSLGAEKSFRVFTSRLHDRGRFKVTQEYYERLIAKAILFRQAEKAISQMNYGGYRANIVTYTLAYLSRVTGQRLDLDAIWAAQDISEDLRTAIQDHSRDVRDVLLSPPGGGNITEWCKKPACWEQVRKLDLSISRGLKKQLADPDHDSWRLAELVVEAVASVEHPIGKAEIVKLSGIPPAEWSQTIRNLLEQGRIERIGQKRGAVYRLAP